MVTDFIGRWVTGASGPIAAIIEITAPEGRLTLHVFAVSDGEQAAIRDFVQEDCEIRFTADWPTSPSITCRLSPSNGAMTADITLATRGRLTRDLNPDGTARWHSGILHVAPGVSAGGTLRQALDLAGRTDHVLSFPDDLSCGPIGGNLTTARTAWWETMFEVREIDLGHFWQRLATAPERLVIWYSRRSTLEYAFFLAVAAGLGDRPYDVIDATDAQFLRPGPGHRMEQTPPCAGVSVIGPNDLLSLLDTGQPQPPAARANAIRRWQHLCAENAPFRIITDQGLVSAAADVFDEAILKHTSHEWRSKARVIGETLGDLSAPCRQVGDQMLLIRLDALIDQGKLEAFGSTQFPYHGRIRRPGPPAGL